MRKIFFILMFLLICICPCSSYAVSFTTYGNEAVDWGMAVGSSYSWENFDQDDSLEFLSRNFGGFTASLINPAGWYPFCNEGGLHIPRLTQQPGANNSYLRLTFNPGIRALSLHFRNTDTNDRLGINIAGTIWSFPYTSGYRELNVIADGEFTWVDFYGFESSGYDITGITITRVSYASELNPVPEPTTLVLLSFAFLIFILQPPKLLQHLN